MLTLQDFEQSLKEKKLPKNISVYLQSLWYDAVGDWKGAHRLIDSLSDAAAASVHAYLHRVEGDNQNAKYWYNRAGKKMPAVSLKEEWEVLVKEFLEQG